MGMISYAMNVDIEPEQGERMNKARRKELTAIQRDFGEVADAIADLESKISDLADRIESVKDEENDAYESMPENLQDSDKGSVMMEAVSQMEEAVDRLRELCGAMDTGMLDEASDLITGVVDL